MQDTILSTITIDFVCIFNKQKTRNLSLLTVISGLPTFKIQAGHQTHEILY
jgi:hypothetical protein